MKWITKINFFKKKKIIYNGMAVITKKLTCTNDHVWNLLLGHCTTYLCHDYLHKHLLRNHPHHVHLLRLPQRSVYYSPCTSISSAATADPISFPRLFSAHISGHLLTNSPLGSHGSEQTLAVLQNFPWYLGTLLAQAYGVPAVGVRAVDCWQWRSGHYNHQSFFSSFFFVQR